MRGRMARMSAIRPAAPAAAETSLQTWLSSPRDVAPSTAYSTNWDRSPAEIRPGDHVVRPEPQDTDDAAECKADGDGGEERPGADRFPHGRIG